MEFVPNLCMPFPLHPGGPLKFHSAVVWSLLTAISTQKPQLQEQEELHLLISLETETPREVRTRCSQTAASEWGFSACQTALLPSITQVNLVRCLKFR